jgi:uncharacterized membrane protein YwaF
MNAFEKFLTVLDGRMTTPTPYGWFHLMWIGIMIGMIVLVSFTCKKLNDKQFRIICIVTASVLILFEIYKQLNFSFDTKTGTWSYRWYAFPFQFCSTPMYVLLLAGIVKKGKFRDFLCSFIATFGVFGGLVVMLYPGDVFISTIGVDIQTMLHHSTQIVMGVFMYVSGRAKLEHKTVLKGFAVFIVLMAMALCMNIIFHFAGDGSKFNMFYIGPYIPCQMAILSTIYANVPYVIFLMIYALGFALAGYLVLLSAMGIGKLSKLIQSQISKHKQKVAFAGQGTGNSQCVENSFSSENVENNFEIENVEENGQPNQNIEENNISNQNASENISSVQNEESNSSNNNTDK